MGIFFPGNGKSEAVKAFAQEYADEYQDMIWINCTESVKHSVASLMLNGVNTGGSEDERYFLRDRLLRMLTDQSILFLDNVNWDVAEDEELQVILDEYLCKVVVISRNAGFNDGAIYIDMLQNEDDRFALFRCFYPEADKHKNTAKEIMACVDHHTMAMEMAARLLGLDTVDPQELLDRLRRRNLLDNTTDAFAMKKDQRVKRDTYKSFVRDLFALYNLSCDERYILSCLALMPDEGIEIGLFRQLIRAADGNAIHGLIDKGLVQFSNRELSLQSLIRETVMCDLTPSLESCSDMIDHIAYLLRMQWHDLLDHDVIEAIIRNIIKKADNDQQTVFLNVLHAAFEYGDKHGLQNLKDTVFRELHRQIVLDGKGSDIDRILFYVAGANMTTDVLTQFRYYEAAYRLMTRGTEVPLGVQFNILSNYGMLLGQNGQDNLAKRYLNEAINLVADGQLPFSESILQTAVMCAVMIADDGDHGASMEMLRKLYEQVSLLDAESVLLADINLAAASVCKKMNEYAAALSFAESALNIYAATYGDSASVVMEIQQVVNEIKHNL